MNSSCLIEYVFTDSDVGTPCIFGYKTVAAISTTPNATQHIALPLFDCLSQERSEVPMNPVTVKMSTSNPPEPMLEQAIRHRAYELYIIRGMAHGHAVDDWLKAEAEIVHGHSS